MLLGSCLPFRGTRYIRNGFMIPKAHYRLLTSKDVSILMISFKFFRDRAPCFAVLCNPTDSMWQFNWSRSDCMLSFLVNLGLATNVMSLAKPLDSTKENFLRTSRTQNLLLATCIFWFHARNKKEFLLLLLLLLLLSFSN